MILCTMLRGAFTGTLLGALLLAPAIIGADMPLASPVTAQDILYPPPRDVESPVGEEYLDVEADDYMQDETFERRFLGRDVEFEIEGVPADEYWERGLPEVDVDIQEHWEREGLDYIDRDPSDLYQYVGDDYYEDEYYGDDFYEDEFYRDDLYEDEYLDDLNYLEREYVDDDDLDEYLEGGYVDENLWDGPSIYIDRTEDSADFLPDSYGYPYGLTHPHTPVMVREDLQQGLVDFYTNDWYDEAADFDRWYEAQESPSIEFDEEVGEVDVDVDLDR